MTPSSRNRPPAATGKAAPIHYNTTLSNIVTEAAAIAHRYQLRPSGHARWQGDCPACGYAGSFSLAERDGKPLVYCHACCDAEAVWKAVRQYGASGHYPRFVPDRAETGRAAKAKADHLAYARRLWASGIPLKGSVAETYLARRGCEYFPVHYSDSVLICLRNCRHAPSGKTCPAMLAKVTRWPGTELIALHRTYLEADGSGKIGQLPARMMLGNAKGGAVRLAPHGERLAIAEGIETALSVQKATGLPAWACLSTSGMQTVILPDDVREVIICADHDLAGKRAAQAAAERLSRQGRRVRIATPPQAGHDFNDMLKEVDHE